MRLETVPADAGPPSAKVKAYLENVVALVKKHALVRDSVPWPQTQAELLAYARGLQPTSESYPLIGHLLTVMRRFGDNHSFFLKPQAATSLQADEPTDQGREGPQPQARYLGNGIGYLSIPGFMVMNNKQETAFAALLQGLIRRLDSSQTISGWVVDVRGNPAATSFQWPSG